MKTLLAVIALTLPTLSSAADYLKVDCYIAEGTSVTKTFEGYVFGTVKTVANRVMVEGKNIATDYIYRHNTPSICKAFTETDNDSYYGTRSVENVYTMEFDFSRVELSCAAGSVVKNFGDLANFKKAMEAQLRRGLPIGVLPYCLDLSNLE